MDTFERNNRLNELFEKMPQLKDMYGKIPLPSVAIDALLHGQTPYSLIEQLVLSNISTQKKFKELADHLKDQIKK